MIEKPKPSTTPSLPQKDRPSLDSLMITKSELGQLLQCNTVEEAFEQYNGLLNQSEPPKSTGSEA